MIGFIFQEDCHTFFGSRDRRSEGRNRETNEESVAIAER